MTQNVIQSKINDTIDKMYDISVFKTEQIITLIKNTVGIKCPRCKSENVNVYEKQTRSSDEAKSKFYTCIDCGNKWRKD